MDATLKNQLMDIKEKTDALTGEIKNAADKLRAQTEKLRAELRDMGFSESGGLEETLAELERFVQLVSRMEAAAEQLIAESYRPFVSESAVRACISDMLAGLSEAGNVFAYVGQLLQTPPLRGGVMGEDELDAALASQMSRLDVLRSFIEMMETEAVKLAAESLNKVSCSAPDMFSPGEIYAESGSGGFAFSGWTPDETCPSFGGSEKQEMVLPMPAPPMPAPPATPSQSKAKSVKPVRVDSVSFSVLSPERVKAGEYSTVDVYMYTKSQRKIIEKAIKAAKSAVKETSKNGFSVSRGTEVSVILSSDDVKITDEVDTRTWDGECCKFDFQFLVPEGFAKKQIAFTCQVLFGGIQITRLHFTVSLSGGTTARVPVRVKRKDCRKAFVSYSHKDENRVFEQLAAIVEIAPRMVFWLDSQSMENGDVWRREIRRAIRNADVFLLFWSIHSCRSAEVEKEWRYAKKKKGIRFILPVPLDAPSMCPPPEELGRHLHFGHRSLGCSEETGGLTFASSKQFRKIK